MANELNLDQDSSRALHRIVRAMHDGECPKCHTVHPAEEMHVEEYDCRQSGSRFVAFSGWRCPTCKFKITDKEAEEVFRIFAPFMERSLEIFERWRAGRTAVPGVCEVCGAQGHGCYKVSQEQWVCAYRDQRDEPATKAPPKRITEGVDDMLKIINDPEATEDEKRMAAFTIVEAVAPDWESSNAMREALQWIARIPCKENPPCSSRTDYACDSCVARAALDQQEPIHFETAGREAGGTDHINEPRKRIVEVVREKTTAEHIQDKDALAQRNKELRNQIDRLKVELAEAHEAATNNSNRLMAANRELDDTKSQLQLMTENRNHLIGQRDTARKETMQIRKNVLELLGFDPAMTNDQLKAMGDKVRETERRLNNSLDVVKDLIEAMGGNVNWTSDAILHHAKKLAARPEVYMCSDCEAPMLKQPCRVCEMKKHRKREVEQYKETLDAIAAAVFQWPKGTRNAFEADMLVGTIERLVERGNEVKAVLVRVGWTTSQPVDELDRIICSLLNNSQDIVRDLRQKLEDAKRTNQHLVDVHTKEHERAESLEKALKVAEEHISMAGGYHSRTMREVLIAERLAAGEKSKRADVHYLLKLVDAGRNRLHELTELAEGNDASADDEEAAHSETRSQLEYAKENLKTVHDELAKLREVVVSQEARIAEAERIRDEAQSATTYWWTNYFAARGKPRPKAAVTATEHYAMKIEAMIAALNEARHVITMGIKVRIDDRWPALRDILPDTVKMLDAALADIEVPNPIGDLRADHATMRKALEQIGASDPHNPGWRQGRANLALTELRINPVLAQVPE